MFRTAELGRKVSRGEFEAVEPDLRIAIIELQGRLRSADFPTIILFGGVDGAGKNQTINLLNEWMDPRLILTRAYSTPSDEELERPEFWHYWRDLPPRGKIGLFLHSWYSAPLLDSAYERIGNKELTRRLDRIVDFETALAADGALIIKFWLHLTKDAQKHRLKEISRDPHESWRVTDTDWRHWKMYPKFITAAEHIITRTSTVAAPWMIIEGEDRRYRELEVLTRIRLSAERHLRSRTLQIDTRRQVRAVESAVVPVRVSQPSILDTLYMDTNCPKERYAVEMPRLISRLNGLYRETKELGISTVVLFEGWDAAGKGGAIRRVTGALDARDFQVLPIAAPTDEERAQHYLWRFWRHLSRAGRITLFDRSWYGRVLVERVEELAVEEEWRRAYAEINSFEQHLIDHGIVLIKYWLHITPDEQLRRFEQRESVPHKRWKLTDEDWRNRDKWGEYEAAVNDMIEKTSTTAAPWTLVPANDKYHARLHVLEVICRRLKAAISTGPKHITDTRKGKQ